MIIKGLFTWCNNGASINWITLQMDLFIQALTAVDVTTLTFTLLKLL